MFYVTQDTDVKPLLLLLFGVKKVSAVCMPSANVKIKLIKINGLAVRSLKCQKMVHVDQCSVSINIIPKRCFVHN